MRLTSLIFLVLLSCTDQTRKDDTTDKCPTKEFTKAVDKFEIKAQYFECEPNWKSRLTIATQNKVIYEADSLTEFEFKEHSWPDYYKISDNKNQIFLEVNDRPYSNYIVCLTIVDDKVTTTDRFHLFEYDPRDFDNDGLLEYAGFPLTIEGYTNDSTYYNPICYVEKGPSGFSVDTVLTKLVNTKLYGEFLGLDSSDKIYKKAPSDTVDKYLNRVKN